MAGRLVTILVVLLVVHLRLDAGFCSAQDSREYTHTRRESNNCEGTRGTLKLAPGIWMTTMYGFDGEKKEQSPVRMYGLTDFAWKNKEQSPHQCTDLLETKRTKLVYTF
jgi:hypothetical protein